MDPPWIPGGSPLDPRWIPGGSPVGSVKTRRPGNGHQNDLRPPSGRLDPAFFWRACNPSNGPVFATVLRLFSDQTKHLVSSFNMENDQRIKAHLLRWFPAILEKYMIFGLAFLLQYFDCLPTKHDTWCRHSIWKMISTSRRIFWHGFQPYSKTHRFSASVF